MEFPTLRGDSRGDREGYDGEGRVSGGVLV